MKAKYKRILLKLSGEAFLGKEPHGIDSSVCAHLARQIKDVRKLVYRDSSNGKPYPDRKI